MKNINTTMYIIVDKRGTGDINSLRNTRRECILNFVGSKTWKEVKKWGWKCIKVDVTIQSSNFLQEELK